MNTQHKELSSGRWQKLNFIEQMANIGSEVERAISWRKKNKINYSQMAFDRALELLDLTVADNKNIRRLKEILRIREMMVDYFSFDNIYHSTAEQWQKYFYSFNYAARLRQN
ncbi:MAG: hypothetical protein QME05_00180 [Candidatus Margulisbacteria bacterium]|nr:hypothetical protein [Candidatus Margulisiibacteriota bacterium]